MIPNPWVILGVLLALAGFYGYGHHKGWNDRDAEMQAEIAVKNEEARTKEQELAKQLNDQSSKLMEANNVITEKQSSLDRAIRAGRVRLPSTERCIQPPENTSSTNRDSTDGSESDRQTLLLIAQIASDGDKAINRLNACISAYEQVRAKLNGMGRE